MGKYIKVFDTHADYESFIESDEYVRPNISYCKQESEVHYDEDPVVDYSKKYLTYEILNDNTNVHITISKDFDTTAISYISYSTDNGNSWTTINNEDNKSSDLTHSFVANKGDYVMWRAEAQTISAHNSSYDGGYINGCKIQCDDEYNVLGNIMSLLYGDSFYGEYSLADRACCFAGLFKNEPIVSAENLVLPATTLADHCYYEMFSGTSLTTVPALPATILASYCYGAMFYDCTSLATAPELPATTLAEGCYQSMFNACTSLTTAPVLSATTLESNCYCGMFKNCTSLTIAPALSATSLTFRCYYEMFRGCASLTTPPELPAETLEQGCYSYMFVDCTSLTTAPELPATTLKGACYQHMFEGCTSLTTAPTLPATTLKNYCYSNMFSGCTSLTAAPTLPATVLIQGCYYGMFYNCTSLNYIKAMFTTTPSGSSPNYYTGEWVSGVASTGTFVKNTAATWDVIGVDGVPTGWTVQTANE